MKKQEGFQLRVKPNMSAIQMLLVSSLAISGFFAVIFLQRVSVFYWSVSRSIGIFLFGLLLAISIGLVIYFFKLMQIKGSAIVFGAKEWKDSVSPLFLGVRLLKEIEQVRIHDVGPITCLELTLKEEVLNAKSGWKPKLYVRIAGHRLFIPLVFLNISRLDLESQFGHLENIMHKQQKAEGFIEDFNRITQMDGPPPVSSGTSRNIFSQLQKESDQPPETPAHPVFAEVARRKTEFLQKGLDRILCDVFVDFVRDLPDQTREESKRIPDGVHLLRHRVERPEYEEVEFSWKSTIMQMGLRTNLDEGTEALLSLAVDGEVKVSLRVGVEIGTLEARDLERYLPGNWEDILKKLDQAVKLVKLGKDQGEDPDKTVVHSAEKKPDLEKLKKNFGLKDSGD